jgi:hypothetical protein
MLASFLVQPRCISHHRVSCHANADRPKKATSTSRQASTPAQARVVMMIRLKPPTMIDRCRASAFDTLQSWAARSSSKGDEAMGLGRGARRGDPCRLVVTPDLPRAQWFRARGAPPPPPKRSKGRAALALDAAVDGRAALARRHPRRREPHRCGRPKPRRLDRREPHRLGRGKPGREPARRAIALDLRPRPTLCSPPMAGERGPSRRWYDLLWLEAPGPTAAFWGAVALFTAAFFATPYLPLIDYPQHVAIGAILRRLADPAAPEHALYETNFITYNGGFHVAVAALAFVLPAETAGRVVMGCFPTLYALAALAVVREARRPRWYASLALPLTYGRAMAWGFANWNLTFPVAILALTWWLRYQRGERSMLPRLLAASLFCAYGHVLAMLCLCFAIGVAQLSRLRELGPTWGARLGRLSATPLPVMPGVVWCVFVYRYQTRASFSNWAEAPLDGLDDPLWFKLRHVLTMSAGNVADLSDTAIFALALGVAGILLFAGPPEHGTSDEAAALDLRATRWLAVAFFGCYLVIPKVFVATWFIYERFPPLAMVFLAGALPLRLLPRRDELRAAAGTLAVASGANTLRAWATEGEAHDASAIIDAVPEGHKLLAVTFDTSPERLTREVFVHLAAFYPVRRRGEIAYTFTKFESMPVHYKRGLAPPSVPPGFEWDANKYNVNASWARAYDLTLVHAPLGVDDPRDIVFRREARRVRPLAHRGRFWLFDTSALATDAPADDATPVD